MSYWIKYDSPSRGRTYCMNDYTGERKTFPTVAAAENYAKLSHFRNVDIQKVK